MTKKEFIEQVNLNELIMIAHEVTNTTKHDIFVDYSGHVNTLRVDIHVNGWVDEDDLYSKWLDYKIKQKNLRKRYSSLETYSADWIKIRHHIELNSRSQATINKIAHVIEEIKGLS